MMRLHNQSVITYLEGNKQRIYAFVTRDTPPGLEPAEDARLYVNYWDGSQWKWKDLGLPPGVSFLTGQPTAEVGIDMAAAVITYKEGSRPQRIDAFVSAADGQLHAKRWDGSQWAWSSLPGPPYPANQVTVLGTPGAVTYREGPHQRIDVFVGLVDGQLRRYSWEGSQWAWYSQGPPPGTVVDSSAPAVITYPEGMQPQRIRAFVRGADSQLHANYWDGSQWTWINHGTPDGTTVASAPGAITYRDETQRYRIHAFVIGFDGHLHMNYRDGSQWKWADQGTPSGGLTAAFAPGVIAYQDGSEQRIYAFVRGVDGRLKVNYWNGSQWQWADQGSPASTILFGNGPGVTTYREGTQPQRIYAFVSGADRLHIRYWNGSQWKWVDQGSP